MAIHPIMSKMHLWVGVTSKNSNDIDLYFDESIEVFENSSNNNEEFTYCQFGHDINSVGFDPDFLGVYLTGDEKGLETLLASPLRVTDDDLIGACQTLGITEGNMAVTYTDSRLELSSDSKLLYGDLIYVGCFEWLGI